MMFIPTLLAIIVLLTKSGQADKVAYFNGSEYHFEDTDLSFQWHQSNCYAMGMELPIIRSEAEFQFILSNARASFTFIGAQCISGRKVNLDGSPMISHSWANPGECGCGVTISRSSGNFFAESCSATESGVCVKKPKTATTSHPVLVISDNATSELTEFISQKVFEAKEEIMSKMSELQTGMAKVDNDTTTITRLTQKWEEGREVNTEMWANFTQELLTSLHDIKTRVDQIPVDNRMREDFHPLIMNNTRGIMSELLQEFSDRESTLLKNFTSSLPAVLENITENSKEHSEKSFDTSVTRPSSDDINSRLKQIFTIQVMNILIVICLLFHATCRLTKRIKRRRIMDRKVIYTNHSKELNANTLENPSYQDTVVEMIDEDPEYSTIFEESPDFIKKNKV